MGKPDRAKVNLAAATRIAPKYRLVATLEGKWPNEHSADSRRITQPSCPNLFEKKKQRFGERV